MPEAQETFASSSPKQHLTDKRSVLSEENFIARLKVGDQIAYGKLRELLGNYYEQNIK